MNSTQPSSQPSTPPKDSCPAEFPDKLITTNTELEIETSCQKPESLGKSDQAETNSPKATEN